jgi:hypothetical protein
MACSEGPRRASRPRFPGAAVYGSAAAPAASIVARMTGTLLKALVVFVPVCVLVAWSAVAFFRTKTVWGSLQLLGAGCLVVVVLTHVFEALELFPAMRWGAPDSVGHYLDLSSAVLGLVLFPVGFVGTRRGW